MSNINGSVHMPLGPLWSDIEKALTDHARVWMQQQGMEAPAEDPRELANRPSLSPQQQDQLRDFYVAKFALAVAVGLGRQQRDSLDAARQFGATYTQLSKVTGYSRQSIQQRWGLTDRELRDARSAIADAISVLPPPLSNPSDAQWRLVPDRHNYDPEAQLWAAEISIEGATGSSPKQVLLFQKQKFLGPVTSADTDASFAYTEMLTAGYTNTSVRVQFKIKDPAQHNAAPEIERLTVLYRWMDGEVVHFGDDLPTGAMSFARDGRSE